MDALAVTAARIGSGTGSGNVPTGCKFDCPDRGAIGAALAGLPAALPALAAVHPARIEPGRQSHFLECLVLVANLRGGPSSAWAICRLLRGGALKDLFQRNLPVLNPDMARPDD
ncbi:MAG TPA: hypothetical protein VMP01_22895 [Pirellulaceae bacterium]|nr:hypothetical protein [Pirellulaceae bacterium]